MENRAMENRYLESKVTENDDLEARVIDTLKSNSSLRPSPLVRALKDRLEYQWIVADDHEQWELRFLFQLVEFSKTRFRINITMVANRDGNPQDQQHSAYLELNSDDGELSLNWSSSVKNSITEAFFQLKGIYPLNQLITDIVTALNPHKVKVMFPEIGTLLLKSAAPVSTPSSRIAFRGAR
ncbi:hypothetical protein [Motiliproteus sp. MSK22-1]|uniref:hypothetical protein n=1 Tax=Motiliproteus sp. MSK22-1 TaxID=1897630 RepID=UPI0009765AA3|nr:hypothetical protein [Motiliproteus sp. MSK22-1]OMH39108.1 hypothetical protein BGP75_05245 [Motiliproteus sp. MSK22-1]